MRHRVAGRHLGRDTAHRKSLYRNLVTDLLRFERITTTEAKAKEIRPMAERIITLGKRGDLHARRQALRFVYDPGVVEHLFDSIAPRMADRPGGYLRITKLEPRKGDGARMATIELIDYVDAPPTSRPERSTAAPAGTMATAAPAALPEDEEDLAVAEALVEDDVLEAEDDAEGEAADPAPDGEETVAEAPAEVEAEAEVEPTNEAEEPAVEAVEASEAEDDAAPEDGETKES